MPLISKRKNSKQTYTGHRKRIKDKFKAGGIESWLDYEILEFALSYAIARKDTKTLAKELVHKFNSFNGVLDADYKDLKSINGISEHTALFIKLLKEITKYYSKNTIAKKNLLASPEGVVNFLTTVLKGSFDEEFHAVFLNRSNNLIKQELLQKGTIDKSIVYPRKIVERALYHHAVNVIIAHNHPGETLKPSKNDIEVTDAIKTALKTVDVDLLDHIIITGSGYFSFKEQNLL
ncbi:MAG: DNA repair protein RadC [Elusimicrobia bacterium]|nr:DNA repair protein RadC [Candidatus Liberimonas magnetica]